jgi:hypothetical protein
MVLCLFLVTEQFGVAIALPGLLDFKFYRSPLTRVRKAPPMPEPGFGTHWEREKNYDQR